MPRSYRLGKRQAEVTATRQRIVTAARGLFAEEGFHRVSIDEVARRAGVARVTVYQHFGSKLGLLDAVVSDIEVGGDAGAIVAAANIPDPLEAVRTAMAEGCRFWASAHTLARKLLGLAAVDPETRSVLAGREERRLALITSVVERLATQKLLRAGCSRQRAVDVLYLLTSFEAFDQLFTGRRLSAGEVTDVLLQLCESVIPGASSARPPGSNAERKSSR